jgi:3-hydroxyacyl-[acyl-carrier-protein] dehydratase
MPPEAILDVSQVDLSRVVADREQIRRHNPQRFEMEQLDAIVLLDQERQIAVGYKDVRPDEFWVRGHMPGYPLMPGVLICEAAAQLGSYYVSACNLLAGDFLGFGGMENVRFRGAVKPGDRLVFVGRMAKYHRRQVVLNVQGFVGTSMVFHGDIIGVPLKRNPGSADAPQEG